MADFLATAKSDDPATHYHVFDGFRYSEFPLKIIYIMAAFTVIGVLIPIVIELMRRDEALRNAGVDRWVRMYEANLPPSRRHTEALKKLVHTKP